MGLESVSASEDVIGDLGHSTTQNAPPAGAQPAGGAFEQLAGGAFCAVDKRTNCQETALKVSTVHLETANPAAIRLTRLVFPLMHEKHHL